MIMGHLIFLISLMMGLGCILTLPGIMVVFKLFQTIQDQTDIARVSIFKFIFQNLRKYGRQFWKESIGCTLWVFMLCSNILFFMASGYFFSFTIVLISIIVLMISLSTIFIFAYIRVHFPVVSTREAWKNSIAIAIARAVELLSVTIIMIAVIMILSKISLGCMILLGFGIILLIYNIALHAIIQKNFHFFKNMSQWRQQDE